MKNLILILLLSSLGAQITEAQTKKYDEFSVKVDGLGCPFCAYGLEKKFKEFKGIKKVKIQIESGLMTFKYPNEKKLSLQAVSDKVDKAGYTPIEVNITRANGKKEKYSPSKNNFVVTGKTISRTFFVNGKCEMCKSRIETTAKSIKGVKSATWNLDTKQLTVSFSQKLTDANKIMKKIASKGHDTQKYRATDEAYNNLPPCCNYKRKK